LLRQREQTEAKLGALEKEAEARRQSWIESAKLLDEARAQLTRVNLLLETHDKAASKSAKPTIMQAVLEVLRQQPNGMTALEILAEINSRYFDGTIVRTSLSPQLSRLKDRDHKIILRGTRWFLAPEEPSLFTQKK